MPDEKGNGLKYKEGFINRVSEEEDPLYHGVSQ